MLFDRDLKINGNTMNQMAGEKGTGICDSTKTKTKR